jgi:hypothetical protein
VDDDEFDGALGTFLGAVIDEEVDGRFQEVVRVEWRGDSESEVLSQASSSAHSALVEKLERWKPIWGRAGGERGFMLSLLVPDVTISSTLWIHVRDLYLILSLLF